ncbi:MAG: fatty acid desaturase [Gammaproteobacteria bacterium]
MSAAPTVPRISDLIDQTELRALLVRRNGPGLLFLAGHLLTLLLSGTLLALSWGSAWAIPAVLVHGIVIVHLFAPYHECAHSTAFKSAWLNELVCFRTGLVLLLTPLPFRWEHRAHHNYTQQADRDPQMIPMAERLGGYLWYATAIPYFYGAISTLVRHALGRFSSMELQFLPRAERSKVQHQAAADVVDLSGHRGVISRVRKLERGEDFTGCCRGVAGEPLMRLIRMSEHEWLSYSVQYLAQYPHRPNLSADPLAGLESRWPITLSTTRSPPYLHALPVLPRWSGSFRAC